MIVGFVNAIAIFEIRTFEFLKVQNSMLKKKILSLGQKFPYLETFGLEFEKTMVIDEISTLECHQNFM